MRDLPPAIRRELIQAPPDLESESLHRGDQLWLRGNVDKALAAYEEGLNPCREPHLLHKRIAGLLEATQGLEGAFRYYGLERLDDREISIDEDEILGAAAVRNEADLLPYFLEYHARIGVDQFLIVDNQSQDASCDILLAHPKVHLWQTGMGHLEANSGAAWVEVLFRRFARGHWCLVVDPDELFYYPNVETRGLRALCDELDRSGKLALPVVLLDMYSDGPVRDAVYRSGQDPLEVCPFFDREFFHWRGPAGPWRNFEGFAGGLRRRVFGGATYPFLGKIPLFRYEQDRIIPRGVHSTNAYPEEVALKRGALLHFKFTARFLDRLDDESRYRQPFPEPTEPYSAYRRAFALQPDLCLYDSTLSTRLRDSRQLVELGIMSDGEMKAEPAVVPVDPLERAFTHADLGLPIPRETRFRLLKRAIARVARLFTSHQVEVNRGLAEAVRQQRTAREQAEARAAAVTDRLADEIAALRTELSDLQVGLLEARSAGASQHEQPDGSQAGVSQVTDPVEHLGPVPGVNAIGDFAAGTGLIEATRRLVQTAASAGIEVEVTDFDLPVPKSPVRRLQQVDDLPRGRHHDIELWCVNVNEFVHVEDSLLRPPTEPRRYVIGVWAWEAPSLPGWARTAVARVDEIWVPSRFVRDAFRAATSKPVTVWRHVVDAPLLRAGRRSDFGLPEEAVLFFFNFDANSSDGRKNPWGVIRAFERAFTAEERGGPARLVLKTQNLETHPELRTALHAKLEGVNGILIDEELPRDRMNALLGSIDVYTSLHRAEGFGLGIAEAMFLGKPVVVTAYSGNMDYTSRANSCLVGYTLRPIEDADLDMSPHGKVVYEPGLIWAEPNVDQAARWMRYLYDHPNERTRIGQAGAVTVREQFSPEAVASLVANRLAEIGRQVRAR